MTTSLSVSEARAGLPGLLDRFADGEEVTITRHGVAVAVLVHPDALRTRRGRAAVDRARQLTAALDAARDRPAGGPGLSPERADELAASIRASRDRC